MKNKFIKSTIILLIGGLLTKSLGFIIRVIYTRIIGTEGISLFMLVMPCYSLFVTIASMGLPIAISKIVSEEKLRGKKIVLSFLPVLIFINIIIVLSIILSSNFIANKLLHEPITKTFIISMSLVLPFISLSGLIRGYFFGRQQMLPHTVSNVLEQVFKLIIVILILPKLLSYGTVIAINGLILISILSETISIIIFLFYMPKNMNIKKSDFKPDLNVTKDIFKISIPTTSSRFVGNIGYFFEPIILTSILLLVGYDKSYILKEYGIYNAYVIPILLVPSFFINAICQSILPEISKYNSINNKEMVKKRIFQSLKLSFIIGLIINIFVFIFAELLLDIIYDTSLGLKYIKILLPFFSIYYLEGPLISSLQALGLATKTFKITTITTIFKSISLVLLSFLKIGIYSLIIAEIINIILVVLLNYKSLKKEIYSP